MNSQYSKILAKGNILAKNFGKIQHIKKKIILNCEQCFCWVELLIVVGASS